MLQTARGHIPATPIRRTATLSAVALMSLLALTACGVGGNSGSSQGTAKVPSLPSPTASTGDHADDKKASGSAGSSQHTDDSVGPPQMRLDDSPERNDQLIQAWDTCLLANGAKLAPPNSQPGAISTTPGGPVQQQIQDPIPDRAKAACKNKLPLLPPEKNPSLNPHYREDSIANVKCLNDHGDKVHLTTDTGVFANGLGWTYDSSSSNGLSESERSKIENDCKLAAFGGKK